MDLSRCFKITDTGVVYLVRHCHALRHLDISFCYAVTDQTLLYAVTAILSPFLFLFSLSLSLTAFLLFISREETDQLQAHKQPEPLDVLRNTIENPQDFRLQQDNHFSHPPLPGVDAEYRSQVRDGTSRLGHSGELLIASLWCKPSVFIARSIRGLLKKRLRRHLLKNAEFNKELFYLIYLILVVAAVYASDTHYCIRFNDT